MEKTTKNRYTPSTFKANELSAEVDKLQAVLLERDRLIDQLKNENEHLQTRLDETLQDARMKNERSDMIIMKLTQQMEQHQLMLEDMQKPKPLWQRVKARLGWGTVG